MDTVQCQQNISAIVNRMADPSCLLSPGSPWTPALPGSWQRAEVLNSGCCLPNPAFAANPASLNLTQGIQIPAHLQDTGFMAPFVVFYTTYLLDPASGQTISFVLTFLDSTGAVIGEDAYEVDDPPILGTTQFKTDAIFPPGLAMVNFTVVATPNRTSCFVYFLLDFNPVNTALGDPGMVLAVYVVFLILAIAQAVVVPVVLVVRRDPRSSGLCCVFRGLAGPNLLEHQKSRWTVTLMFAATVQWYFSIAYVMVLGDGVVTLSDNLSGVERTLAYVFVHIFIFLALALLYLPLFLSYENRHRLVGIITGLTSTTVLFGLRFSSVFNSYNVGEQAAVYVPEVFILFGIFSFFSYRLFLCLKGMLGRRRYQEVDAQASGAPADSRDLLYVRRLLAQKQTRRLPPQQPADESASVLSQLVKNVAQGLRDLTSREARARLVREFIWDHDPYYRFPQRLMSSLAMMTLMCYDMSIFWGILGFRYSSIVACAFGGEQGETASNLWASINRDLIGICILTFLLCLFQVYLFLTVFKRDMRAIREGRFPKKQILEGATVNDALNFVGLQVSYAFLGTLINLGLVTVLYFFLSAFVHIAEIRTFVWEYVFKQVLLAPLVITIFFILVQANLTRLFLAGYKGFYVAHRRSFQFYDYAFVFINMVRGLISFTGRILYSFCAMLVFSYRMDKPVMSEGLEWMDFGYTGYVGLLALSRHYNNPISSTFIQLLWSTQSPSSLPPTSAHTLPEQPTDAANPMKSSLLGVTADVYRADTTKEKRARLVRNRFGVAITLINNPGLIKLRKRNLFFF